METPKAASLAVFIDRHSLFPGQIIMKTSAFITVLLTVAVLGACKISPHPMDMTQAVKNAKSPADHAALGEHYEEVAEEMQAKVEEHQQLLAEYQAKSYLYGKQAEYLKVHCRSLVGIYERAVQENRAMAALHRGMGS